MLFRSSSGVALQEERYARLAKDFGVKTRFTRSSNIRNLVSRPKTELRAQRKIGAIYKIDCNCGRSYVGESGRCLLQRANEHCSRGLRSKSAKERARYALARHVDACREKNDFSHKPEPGKATILGTSKNARLRRIKEAFYVTANPDKIVADNQANFISTNWANSFNKFK